MDYPMFDGFWGFITLFVAGCVLLALLGAGWCLIYLDNKKAYNDILLIVLAGFIIGFAYAFGMANKYYYTQYTHYAGKDDKFHSKKLDEYMISLWIMIAVSLVCTIAFFMVGANINN